MMHVFHDVLHTISSPFTDFAAHGGGGFGFAVHSGEHVVLVCWLSDGALILILLHMPSTHDSQLRSKV